MLHWSSFDLQHFYQISRQESWQNSLKIYYRMGRGRTRRRRKKHSPKRIPSASLPFSFLILFFFVSSPMSSVWFKNNNCYFSLSSKIDGRHWFSFSLNNSSIALHRTYAYLKADKTAERKDRTPHSIGQLEIYDTVNDRIEFSFDWDHGCDIIRPTVGRSSSRNHRSSTSEHPSRLRYDQTESNAHRFARHTAGDGQLSTATLATIATIRNLSGRYQPYSSSECRRKSSVGAETTVR